MRGPKMLSILGMAAALAPMRGIAAYPYEAPNFSQMYSDAYSTVPRAQLLQAQAELAKQQAALAQQQAEQLRLQNEAMRQQIAQQQTQLQQQQRLEVSNAASTKSSQEIDSMLDAWAVVDARRSVTTEQLNSALRYLKSVEQRNPPASDAAINASAAEHQIAEELNRRGH